MATYALSRTGTHGGTDTITIGARISATVDRVETFVVVNDSGSAVTLNVNANNADVTVSMGDEETDGVTRRDFTVDKRSHALLTVSSSSTAAHSWNVNDIVTRHGTAATDGDNVYLQQIEAGVTVANVRSD